MIIMSAAASATCRFCLHVTEAERHSPKSALLHPAGRPKSSPSCPAADCRLKSELPMSPKETSKEIKKLLDALPSKKTARERLSLITIVKCHVEQIQELFRKERQKELKKE